MHNNPFAFERLLATIDIAELDPDAQVLDVGCGEGALVCALGERGLAGFGLDQSAELIQRAHARGAGLPVRFEVADATEAELGTGYALSCCVGATHAFGRGADALTGALDALRDTVPPGGHLLLGEGYQKQPLPAGYAALLGPYTGIERTHVEVIRTCEARGFEVIHAITASTAEWDAFEWSHHRARMNASAAVEGSEREALRQRARTWRDGYLRWGRATMGFGLYLLTKASDGAS